MDSNKPVLTKGQLDLLSKRFRHFYLDRCAPLFHHDQPENGEHTRRGQGKFPAVLMVSDAWWYPDRERRPVDPKNGRPIKAQASSTRKLLVHPDCKDASEVLVVEGEGHAVAVASVGHTQVVAAGGTQNLAKASRKAAPGRQVAFEGKCVRILFDPDDAGQAAAHKVAKVVLDAGATHVAIISKEMLPNGWLPSMDVEDWLATFDDAELALENLNQLMASVAWQEDIDGEADRIIEPRNVAVESARLPIAGTGRSVLLTTVYTSAEDQLRLAVHAPESFFAADGSGFGQSIRHDDEPAVWATRVVDSFSHGNRVYEPPRSADYLEEVRERALTVPAPPNESGEPDSALWVDLLGFFQRWLVLTDQRHYVVMGAWTLLSWRLNDAGFRYVPPLRFTGLPGTGKSVALTCVHAVAYHGRMLRWTPDNLHRVADAYRDGVQCFDELHLNRGRTKDAQERMQDQFAQAWDRYSHEVRYEGAGRGIQKYRSFLMPVTAGYQADEHLGVARRSAVIELQPVELEKHQQFLEQPQRLSREAEELRGRLLAWRFRHSAEPKQDEEGNSLADRVKEIAGREIGQAFWPLVQMVPVDCPDDLESLLGYVADRRRVVKGTIRREETAELLQLVATTVDEGTHVLITPSGVQVPNTFLLPSAQQAFPGINSRRLGTQLAAAGVEKRQLRVRAQSKQFAIRFSLTDRFWGFDLDLREDSRHREAFESYEIVVPTLEEAHAAARRDRDEEAGL
ncbi:MAG: toprim domain-containing protein [Planctomycetota bacterium]